MIQFYIPWGYKIVYTFIVYMLAITTSNIEMTLMYTGADPPPWGGGGGARTRHAPP